MLTLVAAWTLLGVYALALRARARQGRAELSRPARRLIEALPQHLERHPDVHLKGLLRQSLVAVLEIDGQETPLPLQPLIHQFAIAPASLGPVFDSVVEELRRDTLEALDDRTFRDTATQILPQVRSREWVAERSPAWGAYSLVNRPFQHDLVVCYVIDDEWSMTFVTRGHLGRWGCTEQQLHNLALQNLRARNEAEVSLPTGQGDAVVFERGDGYDAARLLLLEPDDVEGLLVAVPDRDTLWVGDERAMRLSELMSTNERHSASSAHPISPSLYRMTAGRLEPRV